jgi:hypothetical protein
MGVLKVNELSPNTWYICLVRGVEDKIPLSKFKLRYLGCIKDPDTDEDYHDFDLYSFRRGNDEFVTLRTSIKRLKSYDLDEFEYFYLPDDPALTDFAHIPINNDDDVNRYNLDNGFEDFPSIRDTSPKSSFMNGKGDTSCPICMDELSNTENGPCVTIDNGNGESPTKCGHKYHLDCITIHCINCYNKVHGTENPVNCFCPMCKGNIKRFYLAAQIGGGKVKKNKKTRRYMKKGGTLKKKSKE